MRCYLVVMCTILKQPLLCSVVNKQPVTPYGLVFTPCQYDTTIPIELVPKVAFYKVTEDGTDLQYTLDWGQSWTNHTTAIKWTIDDLLTTNTQTSLSVDDVVNSTINPRAPSTPSSYAEYYDYSQFIQDQWNFAYGAAEIYGWGHSMYPGSSGTMMCTICDIPIDTSADMSEIIHDVFERLSIIVTKYTQ